MRPALCLEMRDMNYRVARGMLKAEEREALANLSSLAGPSEAIVNIGVEYGASMVCLAEHYHGYMLIGIDIDLTKLEQSVKDGLDGKAMFVMGNSHEQSVVTWLGRTLDVNGAKVAVLFVDGDHSYEGTLADAIDYSHLVRPDGYVAFHDCFDWDHPERVSTNDFVEGVGRAVNDWYAGNNDLWEDVGKVGTMRIFRRNAHLGG